MWRENVSKYFTVLSLFQNLGLMSLMRKILLSSFPFFPELTETRTRFRPLPASVFFQLAAIRLGYDLS